MDTFNIIISSVFLLAIIAQASFACFSQSLYCPQVEVENNFDASAVRIYFFLRFRILIKIITF